MRFTALAALLLVSASSYCQITPSQQAALNNYVVYANKSAEDAVYIFNKMLSYYPRLKYFKKGTERPWFVCDNQLEEASLTKALSGGSVLGAGNTLNAKTRALGDVASRLDQKCKALDTYHKLEDFTKDNFKQAEILVTEMQAGLVEYRARRAELGKELEAVYRRLQPVTITNSYIKIDQMMVREIAREKAFLDSLGFNVNEETFTGWPAKQLEAGILKTDKGVNSFSQTKITLKYPSMNMIGAFKEDLGNVLSSKRLALDGYNFTAKKSDKYSNEKYTIMLSNLDVIIYDHNQFVEFAKADGFYGLMTLNYVPLFEIRLEEKKINTDVKVFQDIPRVPLKIAKQPTPVPKPVFNALGNYIEFINESMGEVSELFKYLRNYNSSARYYKDLTSFKGKGGLDYNHSLKIPLSYYQKAITQSTTIPAAYRKSLNEQSEVLLNILKELDQLGVALEEESASRRYEKDNLKKVFDLLERHATLFTILDDRKELLYQDVRAIYDSYASPNSTGAWRVSNKALLALADEDKKQIFVAKNYYRGNASSIPSTTVIDQMVREVITNEFTNMKGIERLGSNNGNCPYTPYEYLPEYSKTLSEKLAKTSSKPMYTFEGPYADLIYMHTNIVDKYNKFCELSKLDLLFTIFEPDLYAVRYPEKKNDESDNRTTSASTTTTETTPVKQESIKAVVPIATPQPSTSNTNQLVERNGRDTIYIVKHDTIYVDRPGDDPNSLEGYAANNMVLLIDVSGSMRTSDKLSTLKKSMLLLVKQFRPEDHISIVVYSGKAKIALPPTSGQEKDKIRKVIEDLTGDGDTDGDAGIKMAEEVAEGNYIRGGNNRIIMASDGEFFLGNGTLDLVKKFAEQDIFLSVFVFGEARTTSKALEQLSAAGRGHYEFIDKKNSNTKLIGEAKAKRKR